MRTWAENRFFERFLGVLPGLAAWLFILAPLALSITLPVWLGVFILIYALYWLVKTVNMGRHLIGGYFRMKRNMRTDWEILLKKTSDLKKLRTYLEKKYQKSHSKFDYEELLFVQNLRNRQNRVKDWNDISHLVIIAVNGERLDILGPTIDSLNNSNYSKKKIMVIFAVENWCKVNFLKDFARFQKKYKGQFKTLKYYFHYQRDGEVIGKGPNITSAGKKYWQENKKKAINPKNILVTTLDADHIVHPEYFGRLTYLYVIDPDRVHKSYQPIPLLFNNIWDVPALNRIGAVVSSFWQLVEGMRPYRLRTFAAHTQSLSMLLLTDFWSITTVVEDGHQYWRSYFAMNGNHMMVPMYIPVYQDAVMGESWWASIKNQYKQRRRWAWGVSDFPYVVIQSIKHKEIPLGERILQTYRLFAGLFSWATASFILATAWIPLYFNKHFQDTVFAHNISVYSSQLLRLAWIGIIINVWISLALFPPKPKKYGLMRDLSMFAMWILSPVFAITLSSVPALASQTRLMFGKKLEVFWFTPKVRKSAPKHKHR